MKVIEYARVSILSGFTKQEFAAQSKLVSSEFIQKQPGFISHRSYWSKQGEWIDLIEWESLEAAEQASKKTQDNETCMPWMQMMDPKSVVVEHFEEA